MARTVRFIDLFCGIGGFRLAIEAACRNHGWRSECVFSSDIDPDAQIAYQANFGDCPVGDITKVAAKKVPRHDILLGGFPCQAFSIIGDRRGFEDARGTLFFDIARILRERRPAAFVLENVKQLKTHSGGRTHLRIMETLRALGYHADSRVLNALDFGVAQKRERIFIVGFREPRRFDWPRPKAAPPTLESVLEPDSSIPDFYWASQAIRDARRAQRAGRRAPRGRTIWHENKGGNVSALPYSCALRAGASYNYLLVDGKRRLTEREMLRLQGFPDTFKIVRGYAATRKQAGNSVAVPCVQAVVSEVLRALAGRPVRRDAAVPESLFASL